MPEKVKKLPLNFYLQDTLTVAKELIGCYLVHASSKGRIIGRINETEAYICPIDKACHAYGGKRTARTEPLFARGGIAYIYLIYGMHYCLNVVTEQKDFAAAVLIRGAELVEGQELAAANRYQMPLAELTRSKLQNLSNGPGKLCRAFDLDKSFNQINLTGGKLYICTQILQHRKAAPQIQSSKRIGIDYAEEARDFLWRFTG